MNSDGFKPNLENHLVPLLATKHEETTANSSEKNSPSSTKVVHHPLLLQVIHFIFCALALSFNQRCNFKVPQMASSCSYNICFSRSALQVLSDEIGCKSDEIIGMELNVCDTQPSCLGGGNNEFIYSGRLDNLASCYCALRSLMDSSKMPEELSNEKAIRMIALFDNEEVCYI